MPDMPERPREHVLADQAVEAFKVLLPARWIYRARPPDYGVDGEVELVAEGGQLTGRLFYVQIKGTDTLALDQALGIRFKVSTVNYFRSLDLPVLIVRYHEPSKKVYAQWFESFQQSLPKSGQQTVSIRLSEKDEFTSNRPEQISRELEQLRSVRLSKVSLPFPATLSFPEGEIGDLSSSEIISAGNSLMGSNLLIFRPDGIVKIEVKHETTEIKVGVREAFEFDTSTLLEGCAVRPFAANLITAVGLSLGRAGQIHAAAVLICSAAQHGTLLTKFQFGIEAAFYLVGDDRGADALNLATSTVQSPTTIEIAKLMAAVPILTGSNLGSSATRTEVLRQIVNETDQRPDRKQRAVANYNLANHLNSIGRKREALRFYHGAVRHDPQYAQRRYLWHEIGALLFESGHFRFAAKCYERAVQLGDVNCKAYLADSLLWAGEYDKSILAFEDYFKAAPNNPSEWVLKLHFARMVRDQIGSGSQHRHPQAANRIAGSAKKDEEGFTEGRFAAAIQADGLCGLAYFNQAASEVRVGRFETAAICFMSSALCQPNDVEAWCSAIGSAINCSRTDLLYHMIAAAYRLLGERFSQALFSFIKQQKADFPKQTAIEMLGGILATIPVEKQRTIRIF